MPDQGGMILDQPQVTRAQDAVASGDVKVFVKGDGKPGDAGHRLREQKAQ
jgi:hypothetical protein